MVNLINVVVMKSNETYSAILSKWTPNSYREPKFAR